MPDTLPGVVNDLGWVKVDEVKPGTEPAERGAGDDTARGIDMGALTEARGAETGALTAAGRIAGALLNDGRDAAMPPPMLPPT